MAMTTPSPENIALPRRSVYLLAVFLAALSGGLLFFGYQFLTLKGEREELVLRLASKEKDDEARFSALEEKVGIATHESQKAAESVEAARERTKSLETKVNEKIENISGTVGTLEKLSKTDPQILQKYSKVYFLNENYMPQDLTIIDEEFDFKDGKEVRIHTEVWPFLERLLEAAGKDNIPLMVLSGFRSFDEQKALKSNYKVTYGAGTANQFSADQGYSEHQLGTTIDFTVPEVGTVLSNFDKTTAYAWLLEHAHEYGFILSYPKGNTHYIYEPWHWRFVGVKLATYLYEKEKYFYDLNQRTIDVYIPSIFDTAE